jgi:acyl transferase domain-containing protein/acyl carrier protein
VIVEEAPRHQPSGPARPWQLLVLSGKSNTAGSALARKLAEHLEQNSDLNLADAAYTLQIGRRALTHRSILVCRDVADAISGLTTEAAARLIPGVKSAREPNVVFMFPGQGAQYARMGADLYETEPTFREHLDRCAAGLLPHLGLDLREALFGADGNTDLAQTSITQPALFSIEFALAQLWMEWGIRPQAMIGHSIGEYTAACLAGVFSLEEGLELVAARGRLMQQLPPGTMLAAIASPVDIQPFLQTDRISLAAINGPGVCVLSGPTEDVERLERRLTESGLSTQRLHTSHAFHSAMMDPILESFTALVSKVKLNPPSIPFVSNLTGTWITPQEATDPSYWARHLRGTVQFSDGIQLLLQEEDRILLEVGPGRTLNTLVRQQADKAPNRLRLSSLRHALEQQPDVAFILNSLGRLWTAGVEVDWQGFHGHQRRHRIPLPTYPFERQKFWIDPGNGGGARPSMMGKKSDMADWYYTVSWNRSIRPEFSANLAAERANWLVFMGDCNIGTQLVERLDLAGHTVVRVVPGEGFSRTSEGEYRLNPSRQEDYHRLYAELRSKGLRCPKILHLWSLTPECSPAEGLAQLQKSLDFGFYSLFCLAKAIGEQNITDPLDLVVLSNHMQEVTGEEPLCPDKVPILAPCKVIPQEYPNITCRSIDVTLPERGHRYEEWLLDELAGELAAKKPSSATIAYRGKHRWVRTFEPLRVNSAQEPLPLLRDGGVYLITGGMGGLGLTLAEYLAQKTKAKLVLLGRSVFPAREEWEARLDNPDGDSRASTIRKLLDMEALGAEVMLASADVTNHDQMQTTIEQIHARFGPINGVIHAAGMPGGGVMQLKTPETAAGIMEAKVQGTFVLDSVLQNEKLDFLVFCSSLSSVLGGFGQVDYCAGNAYLDAVAHQRTRNGRRTLAINWDYWQEVGMAAKTTVPAHLQELRDAELLIGISPEEGKEAFERALGASLTQVFISTQDFLKREEAVDALFKSDSSMQDSLGLSFDSITLHPRPNLETEYVAPRNEIETTIVDLWQKALGIDGVGINDDFFALGGHSLLATHLAAQLRKVLAVEMPMRTLFEAPTVAGLALAVVKARAAQTDHGDVSETVDILEKLTDEEAAALLAGEAAKE